MSPWFVVDCRYACLNGETPHKQSLADIAHHLNHCISGFTGVLLERDLNPWNRQSGEAGESKRF